MPVGTQATVKTVMLRDLVEMGIPIILSNSYHLYLRPGHRLVEEAGGLHDFMRWPRAILTDSGGFQVFSLRGILKVKEEGVEFQSPHDGSRHFITPEKSMEIQNALGADIIMAFDECVANPATHEKAKKAVERTTRWAKRCLEAHQRTDQQALFGIVQGSLYSDLRQRSAQELVEMDFPGYASGGLSVGESKIEMCDMLEVTTPLLPQQKPRYLMGVGTPEDLMAAVMRGIDMFDCVMPTRNARHGSGFGPTGRVILKNAQYANDFTPIVQGCGCYACQNFTKAYVRHLLKSSESLGHTLLSLHNIYWLFDLMRGAREAIIEDRFPDFIAEKSEELALPAEVKSRLFATDLG